MSQSNPQFDSSEVSLCNHCNQMTHTIMSDARGAEDYCGKCGHLKPQPELEQHGKCARKHCSNRAGDNLVTGLGFICDAHRREWEHAELLATGGVTPPTPQSEELEQHQHDDDGKCLGSCPTCHKQYTTWHGGPNGIWRDCPDDFHGHGGESDATPIPPSSLSLSVLSCHTKFLGCTFKKFCYNARMNEDQIRELKKINEALELATDYHRKVNEANSILHCSKEVLHSPLTNKLILAKQSIERLLNNG